jgi:tetratricopeptide (TPR) repeat protein
VGESLGTRIRRLQQFYWSDDDPEGRGFVSLADAFRRKGDFLEALRLLRDGLRRHPHLSSGHVVRGRVYADQGDPSDAEAAFTAALELDPRNVEALRGLAEALQDQGEIGEALGIFRRLAPMDPLDTDLARRIGELEEALDAEASRQGSDAGVREAGRPPVWEDPEAVAEELDWDAAALQDDESPSPEEVEVIGPPYGRPPDVHARRFGKDDALVTRTMGDIFLRQGLLDEAEDVFQRLLERNPEDPELPGKLAEVGSRRRGEREGEDRSPGGKADWEVRVPPRKRVVPIEALLIDEIVPIEELTPDHTVAIQDLAPEVIVPVDALAPDPSPGDPPRDAFEVWLDDRP